MPSSLAETLETILVVDVDEGVLGIVTAILKKAHFRVLSAHSGPAALKLQRKPAREFIYYCPTWTCRKYPAWRWASS